MEIKNSCFQILPKCIIGIKIHLVAINFKGT